jgi:hypothetical protein
MKIVAALLTLALVTPAQARWNEKYAQSQNKDWFNEQTVPGTNSRCCTDADGTRAQEEIRGTEYWVTFMAEGQLIPWTRVPDNAIITSPNKAGVPIVWWRWEEEDEGTGYVTIRCFAPGVRVER